MTKMEEVEEEAEEAKEAEVDKMMIFQFLPTYQQPTDWKNIKYLICTLRYFKNQLDMNL